MEYIEGLDVVNVGLGAVLYDVNTHQYYTPNTDTVGNPNDGVETDQEAMDKMLENHELAEAYDASGNSAERDIEERFNDSHDSKTGRFAPKSGTGGGVSDGGAEGGSGSGGSLADSYPQKVVEYNNLDKEINALIDNYSNLSQGDMNRLDQLITKKNGMETELENAKKAYYNDPSIVSERESSLKSLENGIMGNNYETAIITDNKGNVLYREKGDGDSARMDLLISEGNIGTHNHPLNDENSIAMLSIDDVNCFVDGKFYEMRAITKDGRLFSIKQKIGETNSKRIKEFADDYEREWTRAIGESGQRVHGDGSVGRFLKGEITEAQLRKKQSEYMTDYLASFCKARADAYGLVFTEERRG